MTDLDARPPVERTIYNVRTWGQLRPGDVIRYGGRPTAVTRIEPAPGTVDIQALIDRMNDERASKTVSVWLGGVRREGPLPALTILDVADRPDWKDLIADPRLIYLWVSRPDWKLAELRRYNPLPFHGRLPWDTLVALGPDAHFDVCGRCGYLWPCPHRTMVSEARRVLEIQASLCTHCAKPISVGQHIVTALIVDDWGPHEARFHGRKGPCLTAARKLDPENVAAQRAVYDARAAAMTEWRRRKTSGR